MEECQESVIFPKITPAYPTGGYAFLRMSA